MNARSTVVALLPRKPESSAPGDEILTGVSLRSRLRRFTRTLDRTPGKLRAARAAVVLVLLATFVVSVFVALDRVHVVRRIQTRSEPLSADAIEVYRRLADADASVAAEFLPGGEANPAETQARYAADFEQAAAGLAHAGTLAGEPSLRTERIAEIAHQALIYSGLVERARTKRDLRASPVEDLRQASDVMRSTILRLSETLQRTESQNLNSQYGEARSVPVPALAFGLLSLASLGLLQFFLFRRFHRVINVGLILATATVLVAAMWWAGAISYSSSRLESARRHSQAITDALGEAQIAARQARASELLALQPEAVASEQNFVDKAELLIRDETRPAGNGQPETRELGGGGALGAAGQYARSPQEKDAVNDAVAMAGQWLAAHAKALKDSTGGPAAASAVRSSQKDATAAFDALDQVLTHAIDMQDTAFRRDIRRASGTLYAFVPGTGLLTLASAGLAAWGITRRLEEYR